MPLPGGQLWELARVLPAKHSRPAGMSGVLCPEREPGLEAAGPRVPWGPAVGGSGQLPCEAHRGGPRWGRPSGGECVRRPAVPAAEDCSQQPALRSGRRGRPWGGGGAWGGDDQWGGAGGPGWALGEGVATEGCLAQAQSCLLWLLADHDSHCSQDPARTGTRA